MSLQGPIFAPSHRDEFYTIIGERYAAARAEAASIGENKRIHMRVEFFKPIHFEDAAGVGTYASYALPTGDTLVTLEDNCAFFPYGILNRDSSFDYMKWYEGNKVVYIGDWFTLPVYYYEERQGAYKGNLKHYEFRAGETFTFTVNSTTTPTPSEVDAWLLAFVVLPRTMAERKIYK